MSDGIWLSGLQIFAALGQLAGIRLFTGLLSPSIFGQFSLLMGLVTLVCAAIVNPTMQALLRYYPEYALQGQGARVKAAGARQLIKLMCWLLPFGIVGIVVSQAYGWSSEREMFLLIGLVVVEILRMQSMAVLNAIKAHRLYGVWAVAEAWGRPLVAWGVMALLGINLTCILAGYLLVSLSTWFVMQRCMPSEKNVPLPLAQDTALGIRFWRYTLPLLPLGLLGWASGMADRFMIGVMLSPADVGLYVAMYGLASRPILMFGNLVENLMRPPYQSALSQGDGVRGNAYLRQWMLLVISGSLFALVLACIGHHWLAGLMLGESYRQVSDLLPWLVAGYGLLILSHVANRVCYANEATRSIFLIETTGAVLAIVLGFILIKWGGLRGAAQAMLLYYGAQLVISMLFARPWLPKGIFSGSAKSVHKIFSLFVS